MHEPEFARIDAVADPQGDARSDASLGLVGTPFHARRYKVSDVVLAVNEAMANAAEYAYVTAEQPGAMHVLADYDGTAATLTVTVTDEGAWRNVDPATTELSRGRGIPLMRALSDHATVDSSDAGTRVCMEWNRVTAARARA